MNIIAIRLLHYRFSPESRPGFFKSGQIWFTDLAGLLAYNPLSVSFPSAVESADSGLQPERYSRTPFGNPG